MGTDTSMTAEWARTSLREAVERLSMPANEQIHWLQGLGTYPAADELALEFDDSYALAAQLGTFGGMHPELLAEIDRLLGSMSGPTDEWEPEALTCSETWARIRSLAQEALASTTL